MNKYGLVGKKLGHSLSPEIHNYIFDKLGVEAEYSLYEIEDGKDILKLMKEKGIKGFNITIPYKEIVMSQLDFISEEAEKIGAVNLVKIKNGKSYGYNSDYYGVIEMLEKHGVKVKGKICYVLGSGGASKSVIVALHDLGAKEIVVVTRDVESKRRELKNRFRNIEVVSYENIIGGDIVVNTTPLGMYPNIDSSPLDEEILKRFDIAVDVVYNPKTTKFLQLAKNCSLKCVDGVSMLVGQAIKSDELWEGIEVDRDTRDEVEKRVIERLEEMKNSESNGNKWT
ncbi:Shikimate dehydrogenase [Fusobacterium necrogenes]|uniref:Shikimate dehydrogenase (NADP(+)) n=1 Tax=Fusobacterium necrogenes TaxID=858 RepID=A0A377GW71_9FUSO|nr:shikimate dehydrogenase [Fusobacterium necrogenes]STO31199.1 Shikimate dehydrogenase [Fusobacterium necrogenes]